MAVELNGKVALVIGASSGIGEATAIAFARRGAFVVVASRRIGEGEETVRQIQAAGSEGIFVQTDVSKAAEVEALVNKTVDTYGRLDYAFNNAGIAGTGSLIDLSEEDWHRTIDVNLKGIWLSLKYEIPAMLQNGGGAIVNMASIAGVIGVPDNAAYAASKGGVIALTRAAAVEYAKKGVRINVVSPAVIETEILADAPGDVLAKVETTHPIGRAGQPEEVAEAVVWLCSDAASFVTGHNMLIDGGYTAQ